MFIISNFILMIAKLLDFGITIYIFAIIARVILSWINYNPYNQIASFLDQITEPVLSPMVVIFILYIIEGFVVSTLRDFALLIR